MVFKGFYVIKVLFGLLINIFNCNHTLGFQKVVWDNINVGDIIMTVNKDPYHAVSGYVIHTVISKNEDNLRTMGMSNLVPDNFNSSKTDVIGKLCQISY